MAIVDIKRVSMMCQIWSAKVEIMTYSVAVAVEQCQIPSCHHVIE